MLRRRWASGLQERLGARTMLSRLLIAVSIVCTSAVTVAQSTGPVPVTHQQASSKDKAPLKSAALTKSPTLLSASLTLNKKESSQSNISVFVLKKDGFIAAMRQSVAQSAAQQDTNVQLDTYKSPKSSLGKFRIEIELPSSFADAAGTKKAEPTWTGNCTLYLRWSDKTVTPIVFTKIFLDGRNPSFETAVSPQ